jgi:hypothetical protein
MVQRQRMTRGALLPVGRDDSYFAEWLSDFDEARKSVGQDSVIVRAQ